MYQCLKCDPIAPINHPSNESYIIRSVSYHFENDHTDMAGESLSKTPAAD